MKIYVVLMFALLSSVTFAKDVTEKYGCKFRGTAYDMGSHSISCRVKMNADEEVESRKCTLRVKGHHIRGSYDNRYKMTLESETENKAIFKNENITFTLNLVKKTGILKRDDKRWDCQLREPLKDLIK